MPPPSIQVVTPAPLTGLSITSVSSSTLPNIGSEEKFAELKGKTTPEQLAWLNKLKEGAENLLSTNLTGLPRVQAESELKLAKNTIDAITERIETTSLKPRAKRNLKQTNGSIASVKLNRDIDDISGEDFRNALQTANSCVKDLAELSKTEVSQTTPSTSKAPSFQSAATVELNTKRVELMGKLIDVLRRHVRVKYELNFNDIMQAVLPCFADRRTTQCRAAAYRVVRHALVDTDTVSRLGEALDWYIVKSLLRDNKHSVEKEQVIKLIRTVVDFGAVRSTSTENNPGPGAVQLSETVLRAVIAVAEHAEDPFRLVCIQTLTEILLIDIDLSARTGTIRFLLHVLGEGPIELAPVLASVFLHLIEDPQSRKYIKVGTDLEMALTALTDAYGKGPDHADRMKGCARVVQSMLWSWSGLMYFCMDDMRAIRSLVNTLRIPSLDSRDIILDMFFDLLNIKPPAWHKTFIDGRRLTMYRKSRDNPEVQHDGTDMAEKPPRTLKLTDHYLALLVVILTNAGLCEALTSMLEETTTGTNLSRKATLLMAEILCMASRVLPLSLAAKIQAIPDVFCMATDYKDGESRIVGSSALSAIDSFNRHRARLELSGAVKGTRLRANSVDDAVRRGQRQVEQVKLKMFMQMDDRVFHATMLETQVMNTKDHNKWNFETLQALIEGPLLNSKRLDEAIRITRFMRRLMAFFHPFSHRFADIKRKGNARWVRLGCSLLTTLISSPDGVRYLGTEDQFLPQIVKSFAQLDPFNGVKDSSVPIFSKERVADTLTYGYLEMLGVLSKQKEGIELLEKFTIFTAFYHLSELKSREDLTKGIVENLDYNIDGHPRIVLSKALTSSYKTNYQHIRLYATRHLGGLIQGSPQANAWTLRLLLTQLYDPAPDVCELAVEFLNEACDSKEILQLVVEMHPTMDHLGEIGHGLLLKFMSTAVGFRFLYDAGYIHREMEDWFNCRNLDYVVEVEVFLSKVFRNHIATHEDEDLPTFDGVVPSHFYGELAKTELGCQVLQEKGHFAEFAEFIRQHKDESEDVDIIMKLKSILWVVGHIGAVEGGLHFLEEAEVIPTILEIAEESRIPALKGTCFIVLGLISSTSEGAEVLDDYHWEATLSPLGLPIGICIPEDIDKFISLPPWETVDSERKENVLLPPATEHEIEAITAIQNLANAVIANAASRSLARIKSRPETRGIFSSPEMFYRALHMISTQRYRLPVRRYIVELFNQEMDQDLVEGLHAAATKLQASPSYKPPKTDTFRMSVFGNKTLEDDESDEDGDPDTPPARTKPPEEHPPVNLQPLRKIVGFEV